MDRKLTFPLHVWKVLVSFAATVNALYPPYRIVLQLSDDAEFWYWYWVITLIFLVDLIVNIIEYRKGNATLLPEKLHRSKKENIFKIFCDVMAVIPFEFLFGIYFLEVIKLLKLVRVAEYMSYLRQMVIKMMDVLKLTFFAFWTLIITHWFACGWLAIHPYTEVVNPEDQYIRAIYWTIETLTTVGYGESTPQSNLQYMYAIMIMILGVAVYGYVIGNVAGILANRDPVKEHFMQNMDMLKAFSSQRKLNSKLQNRIRDYYFYLWKKRHGLDESSFINSLPPGLSKDVALALKQEAVHKIPIFRDASDEFLREIALQLKPAIFTPGEYVVKRGEVGKEMFFVIQGELVVLDDDESSVIATLSDEDFFGEIALFKDQKRTASVKSITYSDVYKLDKKTFDYVLDRFADFKDEIRKKAEKRMKV